MHNCEEGVKILDGDAQNSELNKNSTNAGACVGFLFATSQINATNQYRNMKNNAFVYCPPFNSGTEQEMRIIVMYLKNNPDQLNLPALFLALRTFHQTWPCSGKINIKINGY